MIELGSQRLVSGEDIGGADQGNEVLQAVATEARAGLLAHPRTLSPWLFYDEAGSRLFDAITDLPEYYLTRTERGIFAMHAEEIVAAAAGGMRLTMVELGAGTAAKTGLLLRACTAVQGDVLYAPIDVSASALEEARRVLERDVPGVVVKLQIANYVTDAVAIPREPGSRVLALYIGSSIGNFAPEQAVAILRNLQGQMQPEDSLLLGTDLGPGPGKSVADLVQAYDDAAGVTAAFNRNILERLNRDLRADFELDCFRHQAVWNAQQARMEMHLVARGAQTVSVPENSAGTAMRLHFADGETIHTENSYKFDAASVEALVRSAGFVVERTWHDADRMFAVTLARVV